MFTTPVYRIENIPDIITKLRRRMQRLENFSDPLRLLADDFYRLQRNWMDSEGRGRWPNLNARYAAWKLKRVGQKPMLQFSGAMYDDLTGVSEAGLRITATRVTIRAVRSGNRWKYHTEGRATGNVSGQRRKRRQVLSPALRIRQQYWNSLLARWASGENI